MVILFQIPKDWVLFVIIILVVAIDLLIILIGTAIPSSRLNASEVGDVEHPSATDVSYIYPVILHSVMLNTPLYLGFASTCMS